MARPQRLEFAGAIYHLTSRGSDWQKVFFTDALESTSSIQERGF